MAWRPCVALPSDPAWVDERHSVAGSAGAEASVNARAMNAAIAWVFVGACPAACGGASSDMHASARVRDTLPAAPVTDDADAAMQRAMRDSTVWPSYGRDYTNQRYSPLSQVNAS